MSDERARERHGTENERAGDAAALDRTLEEATASLESARAMWSLRKTVGRNLRVAIRCLLEAQERIEVEGPSTTSRLDLLEAIRLIGAVEQVLKEPETGPSPAPLPAPGAPRVVPEAPDPSNRRAYQRLPAHYLVQLEPEHRASRQDIAGLPLNGATVNMSRGGMLATIEQGILRHGRYRIRFVEASGAIRPEITWGAVRRSRARNRGWEVGIEFDDPLDVVR